jgi:DNA-binding transcriptional LysR family regulator
VQNSTKLKLPNWEDVRYFLELARQGKLTTTARVLGVEHSTVARRVAALEATLGLRLFDRLPKIWVLTAEGEGLVDYARRIEEEALAFSRASEGYGTSRGTVRVSAPPVFASAFLAARLAQARERWPGIAIELVGESRHADLYRREADLALRLSRPEEPGLAARPLGEVGYALYGAPAWQGRPQSQWEFVGYDALLSETPQQQWIEELAGARPFNLRTNDLATMLQACRGGLGLAALPHFLVRGDSALMRFDDYPCPVSRPLWLVVHPDVRRSARVKAVAELVVDLIEQAADVLA